MYISNFTGALVAGAIAISAGFASPVAAANDSERLARIVLGAAAVGLVAHKIRKNKKRRAEVSRQNTYRYRDDHSGYHNNRPRTCLRKKYTGHGWKTYYSRKCLAQHRGHRRDHYDNHRHNDYVNSRRHKDSRYGHKYNSGKSHNKRDINNDYFRKWNDTHN
jgi:hypothetical protein